MISKTEKEIMQCWKGKNLNVPMVTICCATYNHERYIGKAIESFLSQVTSFPFEIVIHDDASTDSTAEIIKDYELKYPHILKPIYEIENQYSKHDGSLARIMKEHTLGEFVAVCEGDDYWCDEKKLQKQYDYMTEHKRCSLCCHNTISHDLKGLKSDQKFNEWTKVHKLSNEEIFMRTYVHTSSFFYKRDLLNITEGFVTRFGDYVCLTLAHYIGEVIALPDVMSVYNRNVPSGMMATYHIAGTNTYRETMKSQRDYLKKYNELTKGQFKDIVNLKIAELTFQVSINKDELFEAAYILRRSEKYRNIIKKQKVIRRIKWYWKVYGSVFGDVWYRTMLLRYKLQENKKWKQQKS